MELILSKFYHKKNLMILNLLEIKETMFNYINLISSLLIYSFKLLIIRIIILTKKALPIKIKTYIRKNFLNHKLWNYAIFFNKWIKNPPSINTLRQINFIAFNFISYFFIPLLIIVLKKEKWEILMIEKLKNNQKIIDKFKKFRESTLTNKNSKEYFKIDRSLLTNQELSIFIKFNHSFSSTKKYST